MLFKFSTKQKMYLVLKRFFDILFSLILIIFLFPIMIIVAILVKLDSKGPVIFQQKRPGKHMGIFTIYKFRTMKTILVEDGKDLLDKDRITRIGALLRKTSIDEIPQLFNVLKGDMSFVGPRPFLINDLGTYSEEQKLRFLVLPGITSLASVNGRNSLSIQDKYNYGVHYVKNISFFLDTKILIKTLFVVLSAKNVVDTVNEPRIGSKIIEK